MIREATAEDRDAVQRLYEALCPGEPIRVLPERIAEIRNNPDAFLLVAERAGTVEATVFLTICPDPMFGRQPFGVIENVVVDEAVRGLGIGSGLMGYVEQLCRERGCFKIMLLSSSKRLRAHRFFAALGYSDTVSKGFKKYLGPRGKAMAAQSGG